MLVSVLRLARQPRAALSSHAARAVQAPLFTAQFAQLQTMAAQRGFKNVGAGMVTALCVVPRRGFAEAAAAEEQAEDAQEVDSKAAVMKKFANKLKRYKPTTPSLRHTVLVDRSELWKGRPIKALTVGLRKSGGRNNSGRITIRHRGGGHKRRYRFIDFKREVMDTPGVIQRFEYDPNRSSHIALVAYPGGELTYILRPQELEVGDVVMASRSQEIEPRIGNAMPLGLMPVGTVFHNMEMIPGKGGQIARSAGTQCQLLDKNTGKKGYALVSICSKEQRYVPLACMATVGTVSNPVHFLRKLGKAGRSRWLGRRPKVRGVAMNPVDHPMGGGEGKSAGGRASCSPTGVLAKGFKTRRKKKNPLVTVPKGGLKKKRS